MSKSSSHLGRPGSAGSQSPNLRKELQGNRSCMLRIGERLMRAGSEGNLVQRPIPTQSQTLTSSARLGQRLNGKTARPAVEDKPSECIRNSSNKAPCSPSTLPRSYAPTAGAGGRDSQLDSLMMQQSDVERKKEVFLDHLRHKYPHHAAIIMGHQDCMRDQVRSPRSSKSPPCSGVSDWEEQDPLASEAMSDGDVLPPSVPFTRGCKARASLPVSRSNSETRERSLGVLYLQYGEETKQVRMPAEISTQDALQALFVTAFPHQLSLKMLQSPNMAIYIKDPCRNIYYNLEDVRNITPQSFLKAYHKDPAHVFNRYGRPTTTEGRISKEVLYGNHSPVHTLHSLQGSMSPPMVRSMPSSPSRMAFGGGGVRGGSGVKVPDSATLPRERLVGAGRSSTLCTSSSAILERRDVKPDEDVGSSKSMALVVRAEGGHYPDSYGSSLQDGAGGRLSIASSQCSAPSSITADMVDGGVLGIPGGLQQYRASIKPLLAYGESMEHQTRSLHRPKNRKYGDSQLPPMGTKSSSPSPHRAAEVRMMDGQIIGGLGMVSPERMSPIHRPLRRESNGATVEVLNRSRASGSSSSTSSVFMDSPLGQPERLVQGHVAVGNTQSDRMKAMEEQIASLAGLVHHALAMGPDVPGTKDAASENAERKLINNRHGAPPEPHNPASLIDSFSPAPLALQAPPSQSGLQQHLVSVKRNVCELRQQLNQLRQLQLSNQESVSSMVRMAGQELVVLMCDWLVQSEEASYRQRAEMEEERIHYLATEDRILKQLSELEDYVDHLQRSSTSVPSQSITLGDVEEGAVNLRRVGEALAKLKGVFPELQVKMRSVLRLEVEAVRFLKEEPHKMDSMLKRVKALTEILSSLRRCVSESTSPGRSAKVGPVNVQETDQGLPKTQSPQSSPKPQPRSSIRSPMSASLVSGSHTEAGLSGSVSPIMAHRMKSTAAPVAQPSHHYPSSPLTPSHGRDSPTMTKVNPHSREGSPALQRRTFAHQSDGPDQPVPTQQSHSDKTMNTERQTPEGCQSETSDMIQSSTSQVNQPTSSDSSQPSSINTSTNPDHVLQEAHGSLVKSTPDPGASDPAESYSDSASRQSTLNASELEQGTPLDMTLQEPQVLLSNTQEDTCLKQSDEVDSSQKKTSDSAVMSQLPAASVEPLPSPARSAVRSAPDSERSSRPQMEKPRRSSVEKEMRQSPDRASKSPPPPPPRRSHAVSSGFITGRSGDVSVTTMKSRDHESGAQEKGDKEKEPPQPKPPRQPPEVKPKPQMFVPPVASSTSSPPTGRAHSEEEEDEEEEGHNKFMKELQTSSSSSSLSAQRSNAKSRHSSSSGSPDKTPKSQQQVIPKQPSQADSRSSRAAGDSNHCAVALRASKIPSLCHSSGKHPSASLSAPHCSDITDSIQILSSSSSAPSASASSSSSSSSSGKQTPALNVSQCPSRSSSPSSSPRSRHQAFLCPLSSSSVSPSASSPGSPSPSFPSLSSGQHPHRSFVPSLNLSRLLPSSSHVLSPSPANVSSTRHGPGGGGGGSSKRQHRLVLTTTTATATPQHSYYSSSSYSSSSPSSSSASSSLSPTSSSSSPPSPSASLLPAMVSHGGARGVQVSASSPGSPVRGKKRAGSQAVRMLRAVATASKDAK